MNHYNMRIFLFSIFSILSCNHGHPDNSYNPGDYQYDAAASYDYDYGPDSSYSEEELAKDVHKPVILSQPSQIQVELGHTIRLPCIVDRLPEALQILWTHVAQDHIIIAMGDRILAPAYTKRANVTVTGSGSTLVISSAKAEDAGEYKCSVALDGDSPPEIVHIVSITGPTTGKLDEPEVISAKQGDDVTLSCSAVGHPTPHLSWTREGKHMPDGAESIAGEKLTLENVSPAHAGTYTCTAANGNGSPVSNRIVVNIEYKPVVELEEVFVHTQAGNKVEIVCKVHGHPHPAVQWRKDGEVIKKDKNRIKIHHFGSKYSLSIKSVEREDYGSYSCQASNSMGTSTAVQEISGKASPAQFKSSPKGTEESSYLLEWSSMSYSPITKFHLETRQAGTSAWHPYSVSPHAGQELYHSAGKLYLTKLELATAYQARVKSINEEGFSRWSQIFSFATRGGEPRQEQMTQSAAGKQLLISHIIFILTSLMLRFL